MLPWLIAIIAITILLDFARAVENEQSRLLGELVGSPRARSGPRRRTAADLLDFEDPDFTTGCAGRRCRASSVRCRP